MSKTPSKLPWFAVTGRIPGDDEDSSCVYQAADEREARKLFTKEIYSLLWNPKQAEAFTIKRYGSSVFINSVVTSKTKITIL